MIRGLKFHASLLLLNIEKLRHIFRISSRFSAFFRLNMSALALKKVNVNEKFARKSAHLSFSVFSLILLAVTLSAPVGATQDFLYEELREEYSMEESKFYFRFENGDYFTAPIPNGQTTPGLVYVEFSEGIMWTAEHDGQVIEYVSGEQLFLEGNYSFTVFSPKSGKRGEFLFQISSTSAKPTDDDAVQTVYLSHSYTEDGMFSYGFDNGKSFSSNIPNGIITNNPVQFFADEELICFLIKDGTALNYERGSVLTEDGYYFMRIIAATMPDLSEISSFAGDGNVPDGNYSIEALEEGLRDMEVSGEIPKSLTGSSVCQAIFTFRILTAPTREIAVFNVPTGFEFDSINLDGERIEPSGNNNHQFNSDGKYIFSLRDKNNIAPNRTIVLTIDTTPPYIRLEGVTNGFATNKPVSILTDEDNVELSVFFNGIKTTATDSYKRYGLYDIIATDEAGNSVSIRFRINFSLSVEVIVILIIGLLGTGVGYIIYARRSMVV